MDADIRKELSMTDQEKMRIKNELLKWKEGVKSIKSIEKNLEGMGVNILYFSPDFGKNDFGACLVKGISILSEALDSEPEFDRNCIGEIDKTELVLYSEEIDMKFRQKGKAAEVTFE